MIFFIF